MSLILKKFFRKATNFSIDKARMTRAWFRGLGLESKGYIFKNRFGVKFYLPNFQEDLIQQLIIKRDFFDYDCLKELPKYIKDDAIILDIGANIGNHAMYFASFCNPSHIYAFEPVKSTFEILSKNIELNNYRETISIFNYGVGEIKGKASISKFNNENIGGTELKEDENGDIEIISIDDFLPNLNRLDFIKIDVEGFENQVLKGAARTIQRFQPIIVIEIFEENFIEINHWLHDQGYKMIKKYNDMDYVYQKKIKT